MEFNKYQFEETINSLEYEIYSAQQPKEYEYKIASKGRYDESFIFCKFVRDKVNSFPTKKEAMQRLKTIAKVKEKDKNGKIHYYREYILHSNNSVTVERDEFEIIKCMKNYRPEYSKKTLSEMKKCLRKMKEAMVCIEDVMRLANGDCSEETFVEDLKTDLENLKNSPLIDIKEYKTDEEDFDY